MFPLHNELPSVNLFFYANSARASWWKFWSLIWTWLQTIGFLVSVRHKVYLPLLATLKATITKICVKKKRKASQQTYIFCSLHLSLLITILSLSQQQPQLADARQPATSCWCLQC